MSSNTISDILSAESSSLIEKLACFARTASLADIYELKEICRFRERTRENEYIYRKCQRLLEDAPVDNKKEE